MPYLYAVLAVILTVSIVVLVINAIVTMKQVRHTARAAEDFFVHAGATASIVRGYSEKTSSILGGFLPLVLGVGIAFKKRFFKGRNGAEEREARVKAYS